MKHVVVRGLAADGVTLNQVGMTGKSANVHLTGTDVPAVLPFSQLIYANSVVGNVIVANLLDYNDWIFHVMGVDIDDDINIMVSLDGVNFIYPGLVNILDGSYIAQAAGVQIEASGVYKFGPAVNTFSSLNIQAIKIVRVTATGSNAVTVYANGSTGAA